MKKNERKQFAFHVDLKVKFSNEKWGIGIWYQDGLHFFIVGMTITVIIEKSEV